MIGVTSSGAVSVAAFDTVVWSWFFGVGYWAIWVISYACGCCAVCG